MFRTIVALIALLSTASAFTGVRVAKSSMTKLNEKSKSLPWMELPAPLATIESPQGFDPLRLSEVIDLRWSQEAELKHGRIAMLATLGWIVTAVGIHLPGDVHDVSNIAAHDAGVASGSMTQILLWTHFAEILGSKAVIEMYEGSGRTPGYFGFDPLKFSEGKPAQVQADLRQKELNNGRLAMLAFSGLVTQSVLYGTEFPYLGSAAGGN